MSAPVTRFPPLGRFLACFVSLITTLVVAHVPGFEAFPPAMMSRSQSRRRTLDQTFPVAIGVICRYRSRTLFSFPVMDLILLILKVGGASPPFLAELHGRSPGEPILKSIHLPSRSHDRWQRTYRQYPSEATSTAPRIRNKRCMRYTIWNARGVGARDPLFPSHTWIRNHFKPHTLLHLPTLFFECAKHQ